jgi:hypothetical protein
MGHIKDLTPIYAIIKIAATIKIEPQLKFMFATRTTRSSVAPLKDNILSIIELGGRNIHMAIGTKISAFRLS